MGDKNITLFALHTHGTTQFGPSSVPGVGSDASSEDESSSRSLFGSRSDDEEDEAETATAEEEPGGGSLGTLVLAVVLLAGIAMVAKKLTGGDDASVDLAESDDL